MTCLRRERRQSCPYQWTAPVSPTVYGVKKAPCSVIGAQEDTTSDAIARSENLFTGQNPKFVRNGLRELMPEAKLLVWTIMANDAGTAALQSRQVLNLFSYASRAEKEWLTPPNNMSS